MQFFFLEPKALIRKAVEMKIVYVFFQTLSMSLLIFFFLLRYYKNLPPPAVQEWDTFHFNLCPI